MAKIEYKDVPVYIAHEDGAVVPKATQEAISASASSVTSGYKAADSEVKTWASNTFQTK